MATDFDFSKLTDEERAEIARLHTKKITGLTEKFTIRRTDGRDAPGQKHDGCEYFVLDLTHDPHARAAILAYADSCASDYPMLAHDLRERGGRA